MKKNLCTLLLNLFVIAIHVHAQPTNKMNYQAIARDAGGQLQANKAIAIRMTVESGSGGSVLYQETHSVNTNQFGLFTLSVGGGIPVSGNYGNIDWSAGNHWLKVEMDINNGSNFINMGESQLLSVPYAMYAASAALSASSSDNNWTKSSNNIYSNNSDNVGIGVVNPLNKLAVKTNATGASVASFINGSVSNTDAVVLIADSGLGGGIRINLTNISNGSRGLDINQSGVGPGVFTVSQGGNAMYAITNAISAAGVYGKNTFGEATIGISNGGSGVGAVVGRNDSSGYGVRGFNTENGIGVLGQAGISGGQGGIGGRFENVNAQSSGNALYATTNGTGDCFYATHANTTNFRNVINAVNNSSPGGTAVVGDANNGSAAYGIWGKSTSGYAGYFSGNVHVTGTLSKSSGSFKIDHPLDPANKYLIHSFVESPDMMNIYNGNLVTDQNGLATVTLPSYFSIENIDFKYQLTVIDEHQFAQARIEKKIIGNSFIIRTDKPNVEISWMVTGVRNDAWAQKHRIVAEVEKEAELKGYYLNPIENGQPIEKGVDYIKTSAQPVNTAPAILLSTPALKLASDGPQR